MKKKVYAFLIGTLGVMMLVPGLTGLISDINNKHFGVFAPLVKVTLGVESYHKGIPVYRNTPRSKSFSGMVNEPILGPLIFGSLGLLILLFSIKYGKSKKAN